MNRFRFAPATLARAPDGAGCAAPAGRASDRGDAGYALVIDDHPLFCDALELTLRAIAPVSRVATAEDLASGLEVIARDGVPGLVVLDLNLPDVTGLDGLLRLVRAGRGAPVLVVSSMAEPSVVAAALQAGAAGYVPKHSPRAVFESALAAIGAGRTFVPEGLAHAAPAARNDAVERLASLTAQQARILELICDGKLNKQIAFDLTIAETTVKAHVTAIMRKLGVQSRTQAVLVAQEARFGAILPEGAARP